ncbi:MAG: PfkB family carbohydrate kinase [Alphaproteobacteria bacterium]|nr:PfkB family carbohydrate kinase [Alphaproteobacteria bacterium]
MPRKILSIGHAYIDVTFVTDHMPTGDEKHVGQDYAFCMGGNAMNAGLTSAKLGVRTDLLMPVADDDLGQYTQFHLGKLDNVTLIKRRVNRSSLSLLLPNGDRRAIVRVRDAEYGPVPPVDMRRYFALHVDGHQPAAAEKYARDAKAAGVLTSLDGGSFRPTTDALLPFIDVAVVSERFCEQLELTPAKTLNYLADKGVKIAAVTLGSKGIVWKENGGKTRKLTAIKLPKGAVVDSSGAGDVFHGAYLTSYVENPDADWADHFTFARSASALAVQVLGTEISIPDRSAVDEMMKKHPNK